MTDRRIRIETSKFVRKEALISDSTLIRDIKNSFDKCDIPNAASKYREMWLNTYLDEKIGLITNTESKSFRGQAEEIFENASKKCEKELWLYLNSRLS